MVNYYSSFMDVNSGLIILAMGTYCISFRLCRNSVPINKVYLQSTDIFLKVFKVNNLINLITVTCNSAKVNGVKEHT